MATDQAINLATKRLIGALTVRDGRVVKSYGYAAWRPAGGLVSALRNLDRWAVDEIAVIDISRHGRLDPRVLDDIAAARVATPISYGGGIRGVADVKRLLDVGCDRFIVESLMFDMAQAEGDTLHRIAELTGRQALIGSVPLRFVEGKPVLRLPPSPASAGEGRGEGLASLADHLLHQPVSEYLITAADAEGHAGHFPLALLDALPQLPDASVIWFGGLDAASMRECLRHRLTAAVAFGNPLHETEHAVPRLRDAALAGSARPMLRSTRAL